MELVVAVAVNRLIKTGNTNLIKRFNTNLNLGSRVIIIKKIYNNKYIKIEVIHLLIKSKSTFLKKSSTLYNMKKSESLLFKNENNIIKKILCLLK